MNNEILTKINTLIKNDGLHNTYLNDVKIYKTSNFESLTSQIYDNCIIFVLQNFKKVKLQDKVLEYNPHNYLVASSTFPLECTTYASSDEPLIALIIEINNKVMHQVIDEITNKNEIPEEKNNIGPFVDKVTTEIEDAILRLLHVLSFEEESNVLGTSIVRELFYRVAKGKNASFLHKLFDKAGNEAKIARSLKLIHSEFANDLFISELARGENMSEASFHTYFKKITGYTPFQYIKKVRLSKAKEFINTDNLLVSETAYKVGYNNISQFSREFKKYFGYPPKEMKVSSAVYNSI